MFFLHYFAPVFLYPWNRSQTLTDNAVHSSNAAIDPIKRYHMVSSNNIMARNLDVPFGL